MTKLYDARGEECKLATDKEPVYMEGVGLDRLDTLCMFFDNTRGKGSYYAAPEVVEAGTKLQLSLDAVKSAPSGTYDGSLYLQLDCDGSSGGLIPLTLEIKS